MKHTEIACLKSTLEMFLSQALALLQMPSMGHPHFEVNEIKSRVISGEPNKIIPITTLDPALPLPAKNCVHFTGKHNEIDPRDAKVVPREKWYTTPAKIPEDPDTSK